MRIPPVKLSIISEFQSSPSYGELFVENEDFSGRSQKDLKSELCR